MSEVNCKNCKNENTSVCDECSLTKGLHCCSCHLSPPCSYCENLMFEVKETKEEK